MEKFTTLKEVDEHIYESSILAAVIRALQTEQEIAAPATYDSMKQGGVWLLGPDDTDSTVSAVFGKPIMELSFDGVRFDENSDHFICYLVTANSVCNTIVIPDKSWLSPEWRQHLISHQ